MNISAGAGGQNRPSRLPPSFVLALGAVTALGPLSIDMYLPALPSLAADFRADPSLVQLTLSACILGLALGQLVVGPLSDIHGRRRPLLVGLAAYAAASLLCVLAPSVGALIAMRFLQGLAGSAGLVIATAMVRDLYTGAAAARFFSMLMLVMGLAPILAPLLGAQVLLLVSWHGIFAILTVAGVLLIAVAATLLPETLSHECRHGGGLGATIATFGRFFTDRRFIRYALTAGLAFAAMFAYIAGSPFVIQRIYGVSPQAFGMLFGMNAFGLIAASQINGRFVERASPRTLMLLGLTVMVLGGLGLLTAIVAGAGLVWVLAALFAVVASQGLVAPNAAALALADYPRTAGSAAALLGTLRFTIGAAVAPLVGLAGEATALPMAVVIALCSLGALAMCLRAEARPGPEKAA